MDRHIDRLLARLSPKEVLMISIVGVAAVGLLDYVTGYEVSVSLFYLGPVGAAAWYSGRRPAVGISLLACVTWFVADAAAGHRYSHSLITIWETVIRLGFFLVTGLLITELRATLSRERALATTDALTGLLSRRVFEERLEHDLSLGRRRQSPTTLVYLDIDNFKGVNDGSGHAEGDRVLRGTGRVLQEGTRVVDTVARLGGDEFALILPDTDRQGAEEVVTKLREDLRRSLGSAPSAVTFSIGAVTFHNVPPAPDAALKAADALMYDAKRRGKDVVLFSVVDRG